MRMKSVGTHAQDEGRKGRGGVERGVELTVQCS